MRPDPPNSTGTRCDSLAARAANMAFSFDEKGERPTLAGTGVPVRVCLADAKRLGASLGADVGCEGPVPCGKDLRSVAGDPGAVDHVHASARRPTGTHGCQGSHPGRSRGTRGQVSTATPAKLDFRAAAAADEGFMDAMSMGSDRSMACRTRSARRTRPHSRKPASDAASCRWQVLERKADAVCPPTVTLQGPARRVGCRSPGSGPDRP